jgi:hypothetical protein
MFRTREFDSERRLYVQVHLYTHPSSWRCIAHGGENLWFSQEDISISWGQRRNDNRNQSHSCQNISLVSHFLAQFHIMLCEHSVIHIQSCPRTHWFSIRGLPRLEKNCENYINKRFISFKTRAKRERAVTWWNPAAQTRPVLDLPFFVTRTHAKTSESLTFIHTRWRKYAAYVQCSQQYTLQVLLLYLMSVMS